MTYMFILKCALKLVEEIIQLLYFVISPDDVGNFLPKHVAYIINKEVLRNVCSCIGLLTIENIDLINTKL